MFYAENRCPFCRQGLLGFFKRDAGDVVLVCSECDLAFPGPDAINMKAAFDINDSNPHTDGRWAIREDVKAAGWEAAVAGEMREYRDR